MGNSTVFPNHSLIFAEYRYPAVFEMYMPGEDYQNKESRVWTLKEVGIAIGLSAQLLTELTR